jgi:WD40 repeat protein
MSTRLIPEGIARVIADEPLRVRRDPTTAGEQIGQLQPGQIVALTDHNPICADGLVWWRAERIGSGNYHYFDGYIAEGGAGDYWLEPVANGGTVPTTRTPITVYNADRVTVLSVIDFVALDMLSPVTDDHLTTVELSVDEAGVPWLAVGTTEGVVLLGNLIDQDFVRIETADGEGLEAAITELAFDPAAQWLAVGTGAGAVYVYAVNDPVTPVQRWAFDYALQVGDLAWQGTWIGAVGNEYVRIWDVITGDVVNTFEVPRATLHALAFSANGQWLALGDEYPHDPFQLEDLSPWGTVRLWNVATWREVFAQPTAFVPGDDFNHVATVAFTPDDQRIVTTTFYGTIRQWSVHTYAEQTVKVETGILGDTIRFNHDFSWLAKADYKGTLTLRDAVTSTVYTRLINSGPLALIDIYPAPYLVVSPDDTLIASLGALNRVLIWGVP